MRAPGKNADLTGTTGHLARWLEIRRYAYTGGDIDRELDDLDPAWRYRRRTWRESVEQRSSGCAL